MHAMNLHGQLLDRNRPSGVLYTSRSAVLCALVLGFSTTFYVEITALSGIVLRPVHLLPWVFGLLALPRAFGKIRSVSTRLCLLPLLYVSYIGLRHAFTGPDGVVYFVKAVGNLVAYWTVISFLNRTRSSYPAYLGIVIGCLGSFLFAALGTSAFGVESRMGSGRWQGFMPGANRFANICLIANIATLTAVLIQGRKSRWIWIQLSAWAICTAGIVASGSRAVLVIGMLAQVIVYLLYVYVERKSPVNLNLMLVPAIAVCVVGFGYDSFANYIPERLTEFIDNRHSPYATIEEDSRRVLHDIAWDYFGASPVLGAGTEAERFEISLDNGNSAQTSSHSTYLHLLSVSGFLGLLFYIALPLTLYIILCTALASLRNVATCTMKRDVVIALSMLTAFGLHATVISLCNAMHTWIVLGACTQTALQYCHFRCQMGMPRLPRQLQAPRIPARRGKSQAFSSVLRG